MIPATSPYAVPITHQVRKKPQQKASESQSQPDALPSPVVNTAIALEYASLRYQGHCPLGMYVTPSDDSLLVWDLVFFVHQGYYADSVLKFQLKFPTSYPEKPPSVLFLTDVFHPLIAQQSGEFNLSARFRPWRPKEHHSFDVLHWIKASFKKHALDALKEIDCLNKEAFRLYHGNTSSFAALAHQSSQLSQSPSALYDPSIGGKTGGGVVFREVKPDHLADLRAKLGLQEWVLPTNA